MKAIIEYSDFRKYMRDFYEERKLRHVFSWREFSKAAGFTSSSYMKVVCDGKSNLSRIGVERTGQAMGLVGFEMDYFRAMVNFGQETDVDLFRNTFENYGKPRPNPVVGICSPLSDAKSPHSLTMRD